MTGRSIRGVVVRAAAAAALVGLLTAGGSVVLAADHAVDISGFAFAPQSVTVAVGDTVTWTNADAQNHTATADDGSWDTGTVASGNPKSVTFATAGTFPYHCRIHPAMVGTLVVAGSAPPATDSVAPAVPAGRSEVPLLLALAAMGGVLLARRRFSRR